MPLIGISICVCIHRGLRTKHANLVPVFSVQRTFKPNVTVYIDVLGTVLVVHSITDLARAGPGTNRAMTDFHIGEKPIGGSGDNLTVTLDLGMGDHLCQMH